MPLYKCISPFGEKKFEGRLWPGMKPDDRFIRLIFVTIKYRACETWENMYNKKEIIMIRGGYETET